MGAVALKYAAHSHGGDAFQKGTGDNSVGL